MAAGNRQNHIKARRCIKDAAPPPRGVFGWTCGVVLFGASLGGCQPQPETILADYQARLGRVLHLEAVPLTKTTVAALPGTQQLSLIITAASIDLLDMLALDICDLETLIAARNNSLGKVMADSSQLQYELQLLVRLGQCLQTPSKLTQLPPALQNQLADIYQQKQRQLPHVLMNMLSRDPTLRQQLGGSQRGISADQGGIAETSQALAQLGQLRQLIEAGDYAAASKIEINSVLGTLYQNQLLADLQHSLRLSHSFFQALNARLLQLPAVPLCKVDQDIRENLLTQIFIQRVQVELARIDGMTQQLLPHLLALYHGHPLQAAIRQRLAQPQLGLQQQLRQHVAFWQRWRQCPVTP